MLKPFIRELVLDAIRKISGYVRDELAKTTTAKQSVRGKKPSILGQLQVNLDIVAQGKGNQNNQKQERQEV